MQIIIKSDTAETTLVAGSARVLGQPVGPSGLSLSGSVATQLREYLRAESAVNTDRGNSRSAIAWTVNYEFADALLAETFAVTHAADVQRTDELRLVVANPGGESVIVSIPDTVIADVAIALRGVAVSVTYTAQGGKAERIVS